MDLNFRNARFLHAYGTIEQLPKSTNPEIVFIGRSNVGKSSLLNRLFENKKLAKVSSSPGKTATINFYETTNVYLVDLPGYGYARASKTERERLGRLIDGYLSSSRRFALICILVDIRHDVMSIDLERIQFLSSNNIPFAVILTKADKFGPIRAQEQAKKLQLQMNLPRNVTCIVTSSQKGTGMDELRMLINDCAELTTNR